MLTLEERGELEEMSRSRTLPAGDVLRARLILLLAEGLPYRTIEEKLATTAPTIARWRARFEEGRVAGLLEVRHPGQQPTVITPALQAKVLSATRKKPSDGSTHWSCRKLAKHLHISKDAVQRIWHKAGLKPHRLERYSDDPDFERKATDIIGLYLQPAEHAAIFCVDEKSAIQALDRLDPVLPMSPGVPSGTGFEYYRHGTLSLYADSMCAPAKSTAKRRHGIPATNSFLFLATWSATASRNKKSISFWTTSRRIRRLKCWASSNSTRVSVCTSLRLTLPGLIRSRSGFPKSNAM